MFQFDSFNEFIQMGGHGPYVWASYVISLAVLVWLIVSPLLRKRKLIQEVVREQCREAARRSNAVSVEHIPQG